MIKYHPGRERSFVFVRQLFVNMRVIIFQIFEDVAATRYNRYKPVVVFACGSCYFQLIVSFIDPLLLAFIGPIN